MDTFLTLYQHLNIANKQRVTTFIIRSQVTEKFISRTCDDNSLFHFNILICVQQEKYFKQMYGQSTKQITAEKRILKGMKNSPHSLSVERLTNIKSYHQRIQVVSKTPDYIMNEICELSKDGGRSPTIESYIKLYNCPWFQTNIRKIGQTNNR